METAYHIINKKIKNKGLKAPVNENQMIKV